MDLAIEAAAADFIMCQLQLFSRRYQGSDTHAAVFGQLYGKRAPAGIEVQQVLTGFESKAGCQPVNAGALRLLGRDAGFVIMAADLQQLGAQAKT